MCLGEQKGKIFGLLFFIESARQGTLISGPFPNPGLLISYVGLPLSVAPGALCGTLCHYDTSAHPLGDAELLLLEQASELLAQFCLRTGVRPDAIAPD